MQNRINTVLGRLLGFWLLAYTLFIVVALAKPLFFYMLAAFNMAPTEFRDVINVLQRALLWLVPTACLATAWALTRPRSGTVR